MLHDARMIDQLAQPGVAQVDLGGCSGAPFSRGLLSPEDFSTRYHAAPQLSHCNLWAGRLSRGSCTAGAWSAWLVSARWPPLLPLVQLWKGRQTRSPTSRLNTCDLTRAANSGRHPISWPPKAETSSDQLPRWLGHMPLIGMASMVAFTRTRAWVGALRTKEDRLSSSKQLVGDHVFLFGLVPLFSGCLWQGCVEASCKPEPGGLPP